MSSSTAQQQPQPFAARLVRLPRLPSMAGFWQRFFALAFDLTLLGYGMWLLARLFDELVFRHPAAAQAASGLVFLGYFAALNGPVGGGKTLGKRLFRLRTTTLDGAVPGWTAAIERTVVAFPFTIATHLALPFVHLDEARPGDFWLIAMSAVGLPFAFMLANGSALLFNAFKQGLHDHAAGTVVRREDEPLLDFAAAKAMLGDNWRMHYRQPQFSARITLLLVLGMFAWIFWAREAATPLEKLKQEAAELERPATLAGVAVRPNVFDRMGRAPSADSPLPGDGATPVPYAKLTLQRSARYDAEPAVLARDATALATAYLRLFASSGRAGAAYSGPVDVDVAVVQAVRLAGVLIPFEREAALATFTVELDVRSDGEGPAGTPARQ
ncbi:MAG: RDD family protein [Candidatus Sumerlaeia bacterium]|nr:RDD family protein [Candidatus Sumerlaeia bacterium]